MSKPCKNTFYEGYLQMKFMKVNNSRKCEKYGLEF